MRNKPIFKKTDLEYIIDFDYERSCCHCDNSICRCTTIKNTFIDNINISNIINELYRRHSRTDNLIDKYCFERICYIYKVYDESNYWIEVGGGYYGEEIRGVWFDNEEQIFNAYYELLALNTNIEKIQYCLNLEYGYLIDSVKNVTILSIDRVAPSDIKIPQQEYFVKLSKEVIEDYKDRTLPVCVCFEDGEHYKLIDGYHRYIANKDRDTVDIIVLKNNSGV